MASRLERRLAKLEQDSRKASAEKHLGIVFMRAAEYAAACKAGKLPSRGLIWVQPDEEDDGKE